MLIHNEIDLIVRSRRIIINFISFSLVGFFRANTNVPDQDSCTRAQSDDTGEEKETVKKYTE